MTTILGMAKSGLDLRGAKSNKLELDVLRLIVAVRTIQARKTRRMDTSWYSIDSPFAACRNGWTNTAPLTVSRASAETLLTLKNSV
jgi:hypothetical protein